MADYLTVILSIVIGALAAIVYALRIIVQMNNKLDKIMEHQGINRKV